LDFKNNKKCNKEQNEICNTKMDNICHERNITNKKNGRIIIKMHRKIGKQNIRKYSKNKIISILKI
jgi:hypothetical protein